MFAEHSLLCPNEKVPCINAGNGCPAIMFRYKRARHLEVCPASVVVCTMEWSRPWMCTHDLKLNPCRTYNSSHKHQLAGDLAVAGHSHLTVETTNIALALQDKRMWNKWKEIPAIQNQLGIILCNLSLTSRLIRDVCYSLVKERGIMVQKWKKSAIDGEVHWTVSSQTLTAPHHRSQRLTHYTSTRHTNTGLAGPLPDSLVENQKLSTPGYR
uniref:TRAF-type domain-containing protein n=1 Tax=Timema cristinae TaxID=61476 RepID=A0A7R9CGX3_TIMCR|nr:unnamed protein product [Timema cristinae]